MAQLELFHIPSPCKGICTNGSNGFCQGCYRTRDERFNWLHFSDEQKRQIIRLCKARKYCWVKKQIDARNIDANEDTGTPDLFD
jgi:hypothetical protein